MHRLLFMSVNHVLKGSPSVSLVPTYLSTSGFPTNLDHVLQLRGRCRSWRLDTYACRLRIQPNSQSQLGKLCRGLLDTFQLHSIWFPQQSHEVDEDY